MSKLMDFMTTIVLIAAGIVTALLIYIIFQGFRLFLPSWIIVISMILVVSGIVYRNYYKPIRRFKDAIRVSYSYEMIKKREKAAAILRKGLEINGLSDMEKAEIFLRLGYIYNKDKKYNESTGYFDKAFEIVFREKQIRKIKKAEFNEVFKVYDAAGNKDRAIKIYDMLLEKEFCEKNEDIENIKENQ